MACVGEDVMTCRIMLSDMLMCCYMMMGIYASRAGLIRLIGRDGIFWPREAGLGPPRRNVLCRGRSSSNDVRRVLMVVPVLAFQGT